MSGMNTGDPRYGECLGYGRVPGVWASAWGMGECLGCGKGQAELL